MNEIEKMQSSRHLLLGLESVSLVVKYGRVRWFGHVDMKGEVVYNDRGRWNCSEEDMMGWSCEDTQV